MSQALVRRNSSKVGLQNLMKLTAQRSIEDAEEVERERRRRAREELRRRDSGSVSGESPESHTPTEDSQLDDSYKPSSSPSLEEDEGFSDWTQKRERQRQLRQQELTHNHHHQKNGAEEEEEEEECDPNTGQRGGHGGNHPSLTTSRLQKQEQERQEMERRKKRQEEEVRAERVRREREREELGRREREEQGRREREEQGRREREEQGRREKEERGKREEQGRREREEQGRREREEQGRREREEQAERVRREKEEERRKREELTKRKEESHRPNIEVEKRKEMKVSYTSRVVLNQEPRHFNSNGNTSPQEKVVTHGNSTTISWTRRSINHAPEPEESEAIQETERRLEKIRRGLQEKESQELEQLRQRQVEAEHELEELKRRREERRLIREEEERRREEEEQNRLAKEEEEKRRMKEEIERRRMEAAERMKSLSTSSDAEEAFSPFSPKTPTHKITERTESLSRSLKKSNSFKKTPPLVPTSKIDDKLEQYTHAIETSTETRSVKAAPSDLPSTPEVATKKNLFEAGEVFCQSPTKVPGCKDTEGLKVGVANLITQWVKGPNDSSRQGPGKPTDVKPGDVMQKRNMWEGMGESSMRPGQRKGSTSGKKYKFVVTGHGKYEKIPVDDDETEGPFADDL
ncbi:non-muscle caldesmon [Periophthalmus magnuspinnatus]|uniref:non-muscle caldesmon n=1 Tax=Periophthalmus magnuspinnatus TaxID=409849 RepID=UPI002436B014|nr:non-muscle caldesmon [Periophthalmus magnuspinnatus]